MPSKWTAEVIARVVVLALVLIAVTLFWLRQDKLQEAAAQNEHRGAVLNATDGTLKDDGIIDDSRAQAEAGVLQARDNYQTQKKKAYANDSFERDRADLPVPDSVRNRFRERRLARERSGHVRGQHQGEHPAALPPEREELLR